MRNFFKIIVYFFLFSLLVSCGKGFFKKVDTRKVPISGPERAQKNVKEGRGVGLGKMIRGGAGSTNYEFSTSNPMWRASLETLDFIPLTTVDYSGGLIITDWNSDGINSTSDSLKITVRFLSNEIRSDSLKIIVHKKNCKNLNNCNISLLPASSKIRAELLEVILQKAALIEKESKDKKKK